METSYHDNYANKLQRLLHVVIKSHKRFSKALEHTDTSEFRDLFNRYAAERGVIITELKDAIHKLGAVPNEDLPAETSSQNLGSTKSDIKKDQSVLETIRVSEQETLDTYDDVLQGTILEEFDLKTLIMDQRLRVNQAYGEIDRRYFELFRLSQPY